MATGYAKHVHKATMWVFQTICMKYTVICMRMVGHKSVICMRVLVWGLL